MSGKRIVEVCSCSHPIQTHMNGKGFCVEIDCECRLFNALSDHTEGTP